MTFTLSRAIPPTRRSTPTSGRWCARRRAPTPTRSALDRNWLAGIGPALGAVRGADADRLGHRRHDLLASAAPSTCDRSFGNSRGVRRVEGAKLFFPEEFPDLIAEEAQQLWGVSA